MWPCFPTVYLESPASPLSLSQAQRCVTELKAQVNRLEAEVEEQRAHKQVAMVENEQLRMEVESLRSATVAGAGAQIGLKEADSEFKNFCPEGLNEFKIAFILSLASAARAQAAEHRFSQLKERHAELITSHADLMKKVKTLLFCTR